MHAYTLEYMRWARKVVRKKVVSMRTQSESIFFVVQRVKQSMDEVNEWHVLLSSGCWTIGGGPSDFPVQTATRPVLQAPISYLSGWHSGGRSLSLRDFLSCPPQVMLMSNWKRS